MLNQNKIKSELMECPEIYNLKTSYERHYDKKIMITSTRQKKKIYEYLKVLYNERQSFWIKKK